MNQNFERKQEGSRQIDAKIYEGLLYNQLFSGKISLQEYLQALGKK